jgi:hypothetical protein
VVGGVKKGEIRNPGYGIYILNKYKNIIESDHSSDEKSYISELLIGQKV